MMILEVFSNPDDSMKRRAGMWAWGTKKVPFWQAQDGCGKPFTDPLYFRANHLAVKDKIGERVDITRTREHCDFKCNFKRFG